jgi:photosynthetic reaction center H subunit
MREDHVTELHLGHLCPLGEREDFEVADGDPDIRGWPVFTNHGVKIGVVEDLLIDTRLLKVRYVSVRLDATAPLNTMDEKHTLFPIGSTTVDEKEDIVIVNPDVATAET